MLQTNSLLPQMNKPKTILIGGKAGEGVKKAAQVIAALLCQNGYHVFQQDDYQSLIKGGHNFSGVSFAEEPVHTGYQKADLIVSLDKRSLQTHINDCNSGAIHCFNSDDCLQTMDQDSSVTLLGYPLNAMMKEVYSKPSNVSMAALAICFAWLGYSEELLCDTIAKEFKRDVEDNIRYAKEVFKLCHPDFLSTNLSIPQNSIPLLPGARLLSGNQAIAQGAWLAGLDFYYAYPMTPASSILHYLALKQQTYKTFAIHAESELAAANMAIGSVFAGARTAIGSSGGGFALMQEAFSLAGMAEAPLLCIVSSRPGPATGVSTYTAQEDLMFALYQGHGEFGRIVASPDSAARALTLTAELLSLAWEFQSPVILLTDKHLSESSADVAVSQVVESCSLPDEPNLTESTDTYNRYEFTDNGVSPLRFPGSDFGDDSLMIKWNSHEHHPSGLRTDSSESIKAMKDKRNLKSRGLQEATKNYQRIAVYGDSGPVVYAYGSTVLELREAAKHCSYKFRIVALIYLLPLAIDDLQDYIRDEAIVVEHSSTGTLATYLQQNLTLKIKKSILHYDGRPFDPIELALLIEEAIDA
ncbi:MAG: 2-oxoacid:acceptor oxidoreductase family protein [Candidatus Cloacimonetes bacterium]|nr:2-oxoacid:acceptor oxidoreductase family protein [Candidatus Cloacimonadota bacterium]